MRHALLAIALLAVPAAAGRASAAPASGASPSNMDEALRGIAAARAAVRSAEAAVAPIFAQRLRLEHEAARLSAQIDAEKSKSAGVRRDLDLRSLLASSKSTTDELARVQAELRTEEHDLAELRGRLVRTIDAALDGRALPEAARLDLERQRTALVARLATPAQPLQIANDREPALADPLDGPRELRQKADLLRDSGDKLRREARRIVGRIDSIERRRHLREQAGAIDEDMFGEATSNRHITRTQTSAGGGGETVASDSAGKTTTTTGQAAGTPTAAPPTQSGSNGAVQTPTQQTPSTSVTTPTAGRGSESTVLRNLVDPATLDELRRADAIDDVDRQSRALKRAQGELESLAAELDRRAKALEGRAAAIKSQK